VKKTEKKKSGTAGRTIAINRRARYDYHIVETLEVGVALLGTEVKALREHRVNFKDSYGIIRAEELYLVNCHIGEYSHGNRYNHTPLRERKLLAHRAEIRRWQNKVTQRGQTLIPLRFYFVRGRVKLELALAQGKRLYDKRDDRRQQAAQREVEQAWRQQD